MTTTWAVLILLAMVSPLVALDVLFLCDMNRIDKGRPPLIK